MEMGSTSQTIRLTPTFIEYNNDNSTQISSFNIEEQCEKIPIDDSFLNQLWYYLGALLVIAIVGMIAINFYVEKNSKKILAEKKKKAEEEGSDYSDYSDYSDEEEEKKEKKEEEKNEEPVVEEKKEEEKKEEEKKE